MAFPGITHPKSARSSLSLTRPDLSRFFTEEPYCTSTERIASQFRLIREPRMAPSYGIGLQHSASARKLSYLKPYRI